MSRSYEFNSCKEIVSNGKGSREEMFPGEQEVYAVPRESKYNLPVDFSIQILSSSSSI